MKRLLTVLAGTILTQLWVLAAPLPSAGQEVWNGAFEASPADDDPAAQGASKIRDTRIETRSRSEIGHFVGVADTLSDDNGQHRLGSARCYMQQAAPTVLADGMSDYDNTGGGGVSALTSEMTNSDAGEFDDTGSARCWIDSDGADGVTNDHCTAAGTDDDDADASPQTGGTSSCCTGNETGTCEIDDNKMYVYVGAAGTPGSCPTGHLCGWQPVLGAVDTTTTIIIGDPGVRVKAGGSSGNLLQNGDFDWDGCVSGDEVPTGWNDVDPGQSVFDYVNTEGLQGDGCQVVITDTDGGDGIVQSLTALKANTTYRVTAQVLETGDDECELVTANADTNVTGMVSVDNTAFAQLDGFFITDATSLDTVSIALLSDAAGDECTWDHVAVYRQEAVEVPEAGLIARYVTLTELNITASGTCVGNEDPIACCTGAGAGATCEPGVSIADVSDLTITFVPPTEGWIIEVRSTISIGCSVGESACALNSGDGIHCRLEKGGGALAGTQAVIAQGGAATINNHTLNMHYIDINPTAGTSITYNVACGEEHGASGYIYNHQFDDNPASVISMMAYPPH